MNEINIPKTPDKIETERLTLIKIVNHDYDQVIFDNFTPTVSKYLDAVSPKEISETEEFVSFVTEKNIKGQFLNFTIFSKAGEFLGMAGLDNIDKGTPAFGFWFKEDAQGNGYGMEVAQAIINWATNNLDYEYIKFDADKENLASQKIVIKVGGRSVGEQVYEKKDGTILNLVNYRIYKRDLK